jgi:hypothetical protein
MAGVESTIGQIVREEEKPKPAVKTIDREKVCCF